MRRFTIYSVFLDIKKIEFSISKYQPHFMISKINLTSPYQEIDLFHIKNEVRYQDMGSFFLLSESRFFDVKKLIVLYLNTRSTGRF